MVVRLVAAAIATTALAACSASPTTAGAHRAPAAQPIATSAPARDALPTPVTATVEESQLGPRSTIVVITNTREQGAPENGLATSLEVITPDGARHPVWSVALTEDGGYYAGDFSLVDWRPDLHTALLRVQRGGPVSDLVVSYDVTTGETHEVVLPKRAIAAGLRPDGSGVLMTVYATGPQSKLLARAWDGTTARLPGDASSVAIVSPDGRWVVGSAGAPARRWWVVDLDATQARPVDVPGTCNQIRWLRPRRLLASCYARGGNQLVSVGLDGTTTPRGPFRPIDGVGKVRVSGEGDLRVAGGRTWLLTWRGEHPGVLTELEGSGRTVRVPGTAWLIYLGDAGRGRVLLARSDGALDEPSVRPVLELLDAATGGRRVLVRLERGQSWKDVVGATDVRAWRG